jgi:hypothetical protein
LISTTTLTPLSGPDTTALLRAASLATTPPGNSPVQAADGSASTTVTLGQAAAASGAQTYAPPIRPAAPAPVWERRSNDAISSLMADNYSYTSLAGRFQGLGAALLDRFATEKGGFSQSVMQTAAGAAPDAVASALKVAMQSQLHAKADNHISLDIKTASGASVRLSLSSQDDGLAVQVEVTGGELSDAELGALQKLSGSFQKALDGLGAKSPRLDLAGLMQFDPTVLSSVDFHANVKVGRSDTQTVDLHVDSDLRTLSANGPLGAVKISVDTSNPEILGNARQQAQSLNRYLQQFDAASRRGKGDDALMAMFKDAFTEMNSYAAAGPLSGRAARGVSMLNDADHSMLSGLADFSASIIQPSKASNPMRSKELDTFSYQASQSTSVTGKDPRDRSVKQEQQSHLSASYHESLSPDLSLLLSTAKQSQFYYYKQIKDDARTSTDIAYEDGALAKASVSQSASQSTRVQKYEMARLMEDRTIPSEASRTLDFVKLLNSAVMPTLSRQYSDIRSQQALSTIENSSFLETNPAMLRRAKPRPV